MTTAHTDPPTDESQANSNASDGPTLRIEGVSKRYGDVTAVEDVTMELTPGVVGLLGPNGAGKSTLMEMLTTFTPPTEGTVTLDGTDVVENPAAMRTRLGYLPQDVGVYPDLTAREFLSYLAALKGLDRAAASERIEDLLALVNLRDDADRRLGGFSGGMRQRVGIAQALLSDPDVLVVDEPTVGLDPQERARFRNVLSDLGRNRIVVLSTHIVPDVEATATDVAVLVDGRLRAHDRPERFLSRAGTVWEWTVDGDRLPAVRDEHVVTGASQGPDGVRVRVVADESPGPSAERVDPTFEDAYLGLVAGGTGS